MALIRDLYCPTRTVMKCTSISGTLILARELDP